MESSATPDKDNEILMQSILIMIRHLRSQYPNNKLPEVYQQMINTQIGDVEVGNKNISNRFFGKLRDVSDLLDNFLRENYIINGTEERGKHTKCSILREAFNKAYNLNESHVSFSRLMDKVITDKGYEIKKYVLCDGRYYNIVPAE